MDDLLAYLPTTKKETDLRGWTQLDVIIFSGDAYIDHPQFGTAVIGRVLQNIGCKVAIVPQPDWHGDLRDFTKFGEPKLFFAVTAGAMDSMVNHYTAFKRLRSTDAYSPNAQAKLRPDYCVNTYCHILKKLFPSVPIVIGGIEASMRRLTHYDYWSNTIMPSILVSSHADILAYGMAEKAITQIALHGISNTIPQTATLNKNFNKNNLPPHSQLLHSFETISQNKIAFAENFQKIDQASHLSAPPTLIEPIGNNAIFVNPPFPTMTTNELDNIYNLPYCYHPHPKYKNKHIPAFDMIQFSVCLHRGCFGGCAFCAIAAHQGKFITTRSKQNIINQINKLSQLPSYKGYISDLGGPSANMYGMHGKNKEICSKCTKYSCLHPQICKNLNQNFDKLMDIYSSVRKLPHLKKATVTSGIRYDLMSDQYATELITYHIGGRLKVAPEHTQNDILNLMKKPAFNLFIEFSKQFNQINKTNHLNQQIIPYFISSHPGCTLQHMQQLAKLTQQFNIKPEQVQDFTPTPMTLSTTMFYTELNPYTLEKIYVAKSIEQKKKQNSTFFWWKNNNQ